MLTITEPYSSPKTPSSSIDQVRAPRSDFKETETYCEIYNNIKTKGVWILQCYGVPGSGKSQTVLNLAKKFPFIENEDDVDPKKYVKWHIQCSDSKHDVKQELQNLAKEMQKQSFFADCDYYSINEALEKGRAGPLVNSLFICDAHVLLVIEDPEGSNEDLLVDLCRKLHTKASDNAHCRFHLYMTSRRRQQIMSEVEIKNIPLYQYELVNGFSEKEALEFLSEAPECATNKEAAIEVFKKFGGLPLGLHAARKYCIDSLIKYKDYLDLMQEQEVQFEENENEGIIDEFGSHAVSVFQAIVMPFKPPTVASNQITLRWEILSCLCYFHHDCVPKCLVERCCYLLCDQASKKSAVAMKANAGQLIKMLSDYGMGIKTDKDELIFHQVVFNAIRHEHVSSAVISKREHLKKAIEVLCSIASKDLRGKESAKLRRFQPHLQSLLGHVGEINETFKNDPDLKLWTALLSHLYEITAALMSSDSRSLNAQCHEYFDKAIELLWQEKKEYAATVSCSKVDSISQEMVDLSISKGSKLSPGFFNNYCSKLYYYFNEEELKKITGEENWSHFEKLFYDNVPKNMLMEKLQNYGLCLEACKYNFIFYAERYASVLHTWSRAILYSDTAKIKQDTKSAWMSSLSRSISKQCRLKCEVSLLSEWVAVQGLISIRLKQKQDPEYLAEVRQLCTNALSSCVEMTTYENGIMKNPDPSFSRVCILRGLVRVNAKTLELTNHDFAESDSKCEELFELAKSNAELFSNSSTCMVCCAKYFGARKQFDKALECFRQYVVMISVHNHRPNFPCKCWALYNYARLLACHPDPPVEERDDAVRRCEEVLRSRDVMGKNLNERLSMELEKLKRLQNESSHEA